MGKRFTTRFGFMDKVSIVADTATISGCLIFAAKANDNPVNERYDVAVPFKGEVTIFYDVTWEILKSEKK